MEIGQIIRIAGIISNAQEQVTLDNKESANHMMNQAKEKLFLEQYFSEFELIDGEKRHPEGNFREWLSNRKSFLSMTWAQTHAPCPNRCNDGYIDDDKEEVCPCCHGDGSIELDPVTKQPVNPRVHLFFEP